LHDGHISARVFVGFCVFWKDNRDFYGRRMILLLINNRIFGFNTSQFGILETEMLEKAFQGVVFCLLIFKKQAFGV